MIVINKSIEICVNAKNSLMANGLVVRFGVYSLNVVCSNWPWEAYCKSVYNKFL